jgi:hypothetical protein
MRKRSAKGRKRIAGQGEMLLPITGKTRKKPWQSQSNDHALVGKSWLIFSIHRAPPIAPAIAIAKNKSGQSMRSLRHPCRTPSGTALVTGGGNWRTIRNT